MNAPTTPPDRPRLPWDPPEHFEKRIPDGDNRERLVNMGVDIIANSPDEFAAYLRAEIARYTKIIKDAGIKAE